ncbi:MAG TPA: peptidoglycan DD-metalloendopeptidase family protein [Gammaproteobacteria bacterium]|nr:peptidoglycan DD-metalloendopeptidase family protein [Gammaproteobacteria bacterium]
MTAPNSQLRVDYKPSGEAVLLRVPAHRVRYRYWLMLLLVAIAGAGFQLFNQSATASHSVATPEAVARIQVPAAGTVAAAGSVQTPGPPTATVQMRVRRGDSLAKLFAANDLSASDLDAIMRAGDSTDRLKTILPGDQISVAHDNEGHVLDLHMQIDSAHVLDITREAQGYKASVSDIPTTLSTAYAHGVIENSLFDAANRAGLSDGVTMQLIHLYAWDIDFAHDIQSGDSFNVLYQKVQRQGQATTDGDILAAEFSTGGKTYKVIRYTDPDGDTGYYTPDGHNVRKALIRAPVSFSRISSGFSLHRLNPVLGYTRAHQGVDYAAPTGTPIKAAGDGRIVFRGRKGGYGNCIVIKHGGGYSTLYAHMSRFRRGLHTGSHVVQDQVIGYVGMTGVATGPHLHFEVRVNGVPRNPRTVKLPDAAPILAKYLPDFDAKSSVLLAQLDNVNETRLASTAATGNSNGNAGSAR